MTRKDKELASAFNMDGIEITHHYGSSSFYYVHIKVRDDQSLQDLLHFAELTNCAVNIYRHGTEYRYMALVPPSSRDLILIVKQQREGLQDAT